MRMNGLLVQIKEYVGAEVVTSRLARRVVMVLAFALLTAVSAHAMVPLPGSPVPVTLQTMVVILAGALLGPRLGAASQVAYLAAGMAGLPVFSGGAAGAAWLFGPTGGYLLAFPVGAALTGALMGRISGSRSARVVALAQSTAAMAMGTAVILVGGAAQLAILTGDVQRAISLGIVPFLAGSVLKIVGALLISARLRDRTLGLL